MVGRSRPYATKLATVDECLALIASGQTIAAAMAAAEPQGVLTRLHEAARHARNVQLFSALTLRPYPFFSDPAFKGYFEYSSWFHATGARAALRTHPAGVQFIPNNLHKAVDDFFDTHTLDLFIGSCTPPDKHGFVSLGLSNICEKDFVDRAKTVVLEVNPNLPFTLGDIHVHCSQVDMFIENPSPLLCLPPVEPAHEDLQIADEVASLVEDGATLQLGIGAIPNAVGLRLREKKDLGVHTELLVDAIVDLWEAGVINHRQKTLVRDKAVCTFALGSERLYRWLDRNVGVEFRRGRWVNDPEVIARNARMISINTALAVDLTGQVASETIGPVQYSGTGGQGDTAIGAREAHDGLGRSVIALRSTAKKGAVSTVVGTHAPGTAVTLHRGYTDFVVTEYGIAHLRGRKVRERAEALIAIAHPSFRDELREQAMALGYLS